MLGYLVQLVGTDAEGNNIMYIGSPQSSDFNKYFIYKNGVKIYTDKNGVPIETPKTKTNFLLFAALGLAAYALLKKR